MEIHELTTKNGRTFRVAIENKSQRARLEKVVKRNEKETYEVFVSHKCITNGIHTIKDFETLTKSLV